MDEPIRLDGDVAIVTGAGHGLGRSYALALAERGARVVCNDFKAESAESTAREIRDLGGQAVPETSSVATAAGGQAIVQAALDEFGSVEIVVSNAGQLANWSFAEIPPEQFEAVIATHLLGAFYVTQPAFRYMAEAGYGRIVYVSSSAGMFGSEWQSNYGAAKAGLVGLSNVVALEGAPHGITANAIMPMAMTGMDHGGRPPYSPEVLAEVVDALRPLGPRLTPEHVAPLVVYLASRSCRETHRVFSAGAGHFARVFIAATHGWDAPGSGPPSPELVAAHLAAASDLSEFIVPEHMNDESRFIGRNRTE